MARVVKWDGVNLPEEMRSLPAGRYLVESLDDAPPLTDDEEAGLEAALGSLRRGEGVGVGEARIRVDSAIRR